MIGSVVSLFLACYAWETGVFVGVCLWVAVAVLMSDSRPDLKSFKKHREDLAAYEARVGDHRECDVQSCDTSSEGVST